VESGSVRRTIAMSRLTIFMALVLFVASGVLSGCGLAQAGWNMFVGTISFAPLPATTSTRTTTSAEAKPKSVKPGTYRFTAQVQGTSMWIERGNGIIETKDGPVLFCDVDARWCVELKIIHVDKPVWFLEEGKRTFFVIHSPTTVFGKVSQSRTYELEVSVTKDKDGRVWFWGLSRVRPKDGPTSQPSTSRSA
jgi:hypothetical protein